MIALVGTVGGSFAVDLDTEDVEAWDGPVVATSAPRLNLPRLVAAAAAGATVVAVVDTKPPLVVSHDAGATWRESGRGLPPGRAVAISERDPDTMVYAARNRLYVTRDGGVFWHAVAVELPAIRTVSV
jgi:photosystem II stability/assembly factor-like uncharacterized protein